MSLKNFVAAGLLATSMEGCDEKQEPQKPVPPQGVLTAAPSASGVPSAAGSPGSIEEQRKFALQQLHDFFRKDERIDFNFKPAWSVDLCNKIMAQKNVPDYFGGTVFGGSIRLRIARSVQYVLDGHKVAAICTHEKKVSDQDDREVQKMQDRLAYFVSKYGQGFLKRQGDFVELEVRESDGPMDFIYRDDGLQDIHTGEHEDIHQRAIDGITDSYLKLDRVHDKVVDQFGIGGSFMYPKNDEDKKENDEQAARTVKIQNRFKSLVNEGVNSVETGDFVPMKIINGKLREIR